MVGDVEFLFDFVGFGNGVVVCGLILNCIVYVEDGILVVFDVDLLNGICDGCLILLDIVWMVQVGLFVFDENGEILGGVILFYIDENGDI